MSQTVPLSSQPNQVFSAQLTVNNQLLTLGFVVSWNAMAGWWEMALSDVNGNQLLSGVPLITGLYPAANLLAQYQYLQIGSAYLLNTGNLSEDYPTLYTLPLYTLVWGDNV